MVGPKLSRRAFVSGAAGVMGAAAAMRPQRLSAQDSVVSVRQPADIKTLDPARQGLYEGTPLSAL